MLNFAVQLDKRADKHLRRLSHESRAVIAEVLLEMEHDPFGGNCKRLKGCDGFRRRVGDYRILFEVDTGLRLVSVFGIQHRKDAYR